MILNFGSINIDNVYQVSRFPEAGETISSKSYEKILGGKGINQSIAIQRAGGDVKHIGFIGCLLYTSPSPRDRQKSRMPSSA